MCGRATLTTPGDEIAEILGLLEVPDPAELAPRFNIAPTQPLPIVKAGEARLEHVRWGLVPWWADGPAELGARTINARAETIATKPIFRDAFAQRRCLVVLDGFYEWQREGKTRRPHHVRLAHERLLVCAGVWERWVSRDGEIVESAAIVTEPAQGPIRALHDRMPAMLDARARRVWLDARATPSELAEVLALPPPEVVIEPVSTFVNDVRHEGAGCLAAEWSEPGVTLDLFALGAAR